MILFQVLECCWEELLDKAREAEDLDHVIAAHETFLDQVMTRSLLDNESRVGYLTALFVLVILLRNIAVMSRTIYRRRDFSLNSETGFKLNINQHRVLIYFFASLRYYVFSCIDSVVHFSNFVITYIFKI